MSWFKKVFKHSVKAVKHTLKHPDKAFARLLTNHGDVLATASPRYKKIRNSIMPDRLLRKKLYKAGVSPEALHKFSKQLKKKYLNYGGVDLGSSGAVNGSWSANSGYGLYGPNGSVVGRL